MVFPLCENKSFLQLYVFSANPAADNAPIHRKCLSGLLAWRKCHHRFNRILISKSSNAARVRSSGRWLDEPFHNRGSAVHFPTGAGRFRYRSSCLSARRNGCKVWTLTSEVLPRPLAADRSRGFFFAAIIQNSAHDERARSACRADERSTVKRSARWSGRTSLPQVTI